jgi:hypothetical protein
MTKNKLCMDADQVIALAIAIYKSEGFPEGTFEMLDYETSHKYCEQAKFLMRAGYSLRAEFPKQIDLKEKGVKDAVDM